MDSPTGSRAAALWTLIVLTIAHSAVTARAAPTNMSQRRARDERTLTEVFDRFVRLQTIRVTLQALTLMAALWALVATINQG